MPLGGIDTGRCISSPRAIGYTSIFNHLTPDWRPLEYAVSGSRRSAAEAWVCGTGQTKNYAGNNRPSFGIGVRGSMQESEYWGHYPIADVEYKSDAPVGIGVRSWSPFIPGDAKVSNTPGAVFEVHLRNQGNDKGRKVAWSLAFRALPNITPGTSRLAGPIWPRIRSCLLPRSLAVPRPMGLRACG